LTFEGHDLGPMANLAPGAEDNEYEWFRTIEGKYRDSILLLLIKEHFKHDSEFDDWLERHGIPSEFISY